MEATYPYKETINTNEQSSKCIETINEVVKEFSVSKGTDNKACETAIIKEDYDKIHKLWKEIRPQIGLLTNMIDQIAGGAKDLEEAYQKGYQKGWAESRKEKNIVEDIKAAEQRGYDKCRKDMEARLDKALRELNDLKTLWQISDNMK